MDPLRAWEVFVPGRKPGPLPVPVCFHAGSEAQSRPRPRVARELLTHGPAPSRPLSALPRAGWAGRAGGGGALSRAVSPVPPWSPSPSSCFPAAAAAPGGAGQRALRDGSGQAAPVAPRVIDGPRLRAAAGGRRLWNAGLSYRICFVIFELSDELKKKKKKFIWFGNDFLSSPFLCGNRIYKHFIKRAEQLSGLRELPVNIPAAAPRMPLPNNFLQQSGSP